MIGNCSFPDVLLLYNQPLTVTFWPTCFGRSLMRTVSIRRRIIDGAASLERGCPHPRIDVVRTAASSAAPRRTRVRTPALQQTSTIAPAPLQLRDDCSDLARLFVDRRQLCGKAFDLL